MIPKIEYLHNGLTQQTNINYILENSKRLEDSKNFLFTRVVTLHLPLFLTVPLWKRHGYSWADIHVTLDFFSSIHLWQCALLYGISASNSAIKMAFATPESMVYGSKAIVIRKIEKMLQTHYDFRTTGSTLDTVRDDHIPPLPLHGLNKSTFEKLTNLLPKSVSLLHTIHFTEYLEWNGILVVPLWVEKDALYCVRILPKKLFDSSNRIQKECLSNRPLDIRVNNIEYSGVEEAMFFVPDDTL